MSAERIDVLAVMDHAQMRIKYHSAYAPVAADLAARDLRYARDTVAELIDADREFDAACSELSKQENADDDDELYLSAVLRHQWARDRRAAALARIGGAS